MAGTFIAMEGAFRERNEVSSGASDPALRHDPAAELSTLRRKRAPVQCPAEPHRVKASGDIDPTRHVKGYFEMDFLGAAGTANSRESNSYTPRIRQAYFAYDDDNWHNHSAPVRCGACLPKTGSAS